MAISSSSSSSKHARANAPLMLAKKKSKKQKGTKPNTNPTTIPSQPLVLIDPSAETQPTNAEIKPQSDQRPEILDQPKTQLPTFEEFQKREQGDSKTIGFQSKLDPINPGSPKFASVGKEEEKPLFERIVTRITWVGIGLLVAIEVFINTPLFQEVKPQILDFLGSVDSS